MSSLWNIESCLFFSIRWWILIWNFVSVLSALVLTSYMHDLELPSYLHYGSVGFIFGHELGHAIDNSIRKRFEQNEFNFYIEIQSTIFVITFSTIFYFSSNVEATKKCLSRQFSDLTVSRKISFTIFFFS